MGLKKAWIFSSSISSPHAEELEADGCMPGPSSCSFVEKHAALEMYCLSASGDLISGSEYDWPRVSVAACAHELKSRMKRIKGRRSHLHSAATAYANGETLGAPGLHVKKSGEGMSKVARRSSEYKSTLNRSSPEQRLAVSDPIVLDTVDDLLKHLERIGRLRPSLSSFSTSDSASTLTPRPNAELEGDIFNSQSSVESETEGDCSFSSQSSIDTESITTDSDTNHVNDHDHDLLFGESSDAAAEDMQSLLSQVPSAPCSPPPSSSKRTFSAHERAVLAAQTASMRAFAAYHLERDRELGLEGGGDELFDSDLNEEFGGMSQVLVSARTDVRRGSGARRARKATHSAHFNHT